jgi:uncharacterized peroxidase-related enzyme
LARAGHAPDEVETLASAVERDYRTASLGPAERAMLDYVMKLTLHPSAMEADDVARLKTKGFDDRAIHDICAIAAYYAFVNRIGNGLGVELEDRWETQLPD